MKLQLIKIKNEDGTEYLLGNGEDKFYHLPLNNAPVLEGIELLPPLEDEAEKFAESEYPTTIDSFNDKGWDESVSLRIACEMGYNKAKETHPNSDDDMVAPTYVKDILTAAESNPDAIVFNGIMTTNGRDERKWYISKDYGYEAKDEAYYRYTNHIVPIRREIAMAFPFMDIRIGEDYAWATAIHNAGLIKTEVKIEKELYHYQFRTNK